MLKKSCPQYIGHWSGDQRQARVAAIGLLHRVHRQQSDRVDLNFSNCAALKLVAPVVFIVRFPGWLPVVAPPLRICVELGYPIRRYVILRRFSLVSCFPTASGVLDVEVLQVRALLQRLAFPPVHGQLPQSTTFRMRVGPLLVWLQDEKPLVSSQS